MQGGDRFPTGKESLSLQGDPEFGDFSAALGAGNRRITSDDMLRFEGYVSEIFQAFGMQLDMPGTKETPQRFIRALFDATEGYDGDPKLMKVFETECRGEPYCNSSQIIEGPIDFFSLCEHHALPFYGQAYVGYIPHEHIIGISKLTRLVRLFGKRFTVQERMGEQITEALETMLQPHGIGVYLQAHHLCTQMRGVKEVSPLTRTTFWRGAHANDFGVSSEFMTAAGLQR